MADPISIAVAAVTTVFNSAVGFLAAPLVGALGEGAAIAVASAGLKGAIYLGASAAISRIFQPSVGGSGNTLDFKADPAAPVRGAMGLHATGGNKIFQATWGKNNVYLSLAAALSLGPIDSYQSFTADQSPVTFSGSQGAATGFYSEFMWQTRTLGLPNDTALTPPTGTPNNSPALSGWGANNRTAGWATAFWTMSVPPSVEKRDKYTSGVPDPLWVIRGMLLYDPRKDSTYPGGSGSHRRNDWRTWEYTENPYIHALAWIRGHYRLFVTDGAISNRKVAGVFAPEEMIDVAAYVDGANTADLNNWTISGEWNTSDDKWQTLAAMLKAGGGVPINRGAMISVMVNKPRTSIYTYTKDDMIGQGDIAALTPRRERKNTIIPRYRSQAHNWEYVAAAEVTSSVYVTEDGGEPRTQEVEYSFVRNAKQAGELAAYDLANTREQLRCSFPSKIHLLNIRAGDCITVNEPEFALANQKFIVMARTFNPQDSTVTLTLRSETDGKHAFALGQAANPPPSPTLSAVDPAYVAPPEAGVWSIVARPADAKGIVQPGLIITGVAERQAESIIVEYGTSNTGPWTLGFDGPAITQRVEISGIDTDQTYYASIIYRAENGALSDRIVIGPVTTSNLSAGELNGEVVGPGNIKPGAVLESNLNTSRNYAPDADFMDPNAWALFNGMEIQIGRRLAIMGVDSSTAYADSLRINVEPGAVYKASFLFGQSGGSTWQGRIQVLWYDFDDVYVSASQTPLNADRGFRSLTVTAPANIYYARLRVLRQASIGTGTAYFSSPSFVRVATNDLIAPASVDTVNVVAGAIVQAAFSYDASQQNLTGTTEKIVATRAVTTVGGPVKVDWSGNIRVAHGSGFFTGIRVYRGSTLIHNATATGPWPVSFTASGSTVTPTSFQLIGGQNVEVLDNSAPAGSHTYTIRVRSDVSPSVFQVVNESLIQVAEYKR